MPRNGPSARRELAPDPATGPGRHPLPSAEAFSGTLSRLGVTDDSIVVAYDDAGGAVAARMWWLLRYFGHAGGRVLDGGIGAWIKGGHSLVTTEPTVASTPRLELVPSSALVIDKVGVDHVRGRTEAVVLDARAPERFEGRLEPIDARPGHIPGARSAALADNLRSPGGVFLPPSELAARYAALGAMTAEKVVCYCGSGVTACHDLLALAIAGRDDALLYEGSWSDWARDPTLPAATGP